MSEILARIPKNLTSSPVLGEKKEWILGAASLALGIGSSLFGANKAKKAARRAQAENQYRTNAEKAWYDKNYNTDYLDTKAGQNLMRRAQEVQDEYIRKADGAAAVGGGTAASVAQAKESANKAMGNTIANIAAQDTSRKQHVADIIALGKANKFSGVEIDYENIWRDAALMKSYAEFVSELRDECRAQDLKLRVVLEPRTLRYAKLLPQDKLRILKENP